MIQDKSEDDVSEDESDLERDAQEDAKDSDYDYLVSQNSLKNITS